MGQKLHDGCGNSKTSGTGTGSGLEGTLPSEVEARFRDEFESLIQRMQSPKSANAYDALAKMTGEEIRDFFRARRDRETASTPSPEATSTQPATFIPLARAEELAYPCNVLATLNHFETGVGHLLGVMVVSVGSAKDLRDEVARAWRDYHAQGVEVRTWEDLSDSGALLPISPARTILTQSVFSPSVLRYVSTLHVCYA